ncbi:importin subunit alpha-1b [Fragilaria crotonensis]|nr:importin subunit alpha-1b [Fragilaria crotonensis]
MVYSRRRSDAQRVRIRRNKKHAYLQTRRGRTPRAEQHSSFSFATAPEISDIPLIIQSVKDNPSDTNIALTLHLMNEIVRIDGSGTVRYIVENGCLPFLASLLKRNDSQYFQHCSAWMLTAISTAGFCRDVADTIDAMEALVTLLLSPHPQVREQGARCLGVLANDRIQYRDKLRSWVLLRNIHESEGDDDLLTAMTCALSSMCHGWPQLRLEQLNPIVYFGVSLVLDKTCSNDATTYALKCLADITGGGSAGSQAVSGVGAYPLTQRLIQILSQRKSNDQVDPALRTLRNICDHVEGYDPVQAAVKAGFLDVARSFLELGLSKAAELDMCYLLCKVACGKQTISQLIIHPSVLSNLIGIAMEGNREWPVRKQAIQAICHVTDTTDDVVIEALVKCNGIEAFVEALFIRADDRVVMKALKAIEKILEVGNDWGTRTDL